ncbi:hypothetical protein N0V85_005904 [Neurospora sp. IMI 360204]|nr:hypothetical protein N0V85_005904 [Neurospora sp. IMI 360204]
MALPRPASPYWDHQSDFSTHSSNPIAHRALVSTPRSPSPVSIAPATPFTSPIGAPVLGPVNPAPLNPLPIDDEALLQEIRPQEARILELDAERMQLRIDFLQEQLELTERMRQEVTVLLELSASMVEIDQESIDDFHRQDKELEELEESDTRWEASYMESCRGLST